MHRLIYTSTANLSDPIEGDADLRELAQEAATGNEQLGLTGMLTFVEGKFIQVLEGRLEQLEDVFERICCDFRHRDLQLIDLAPAKERKFSDWGMACMLGDEQADKELVSELQGINFLIGVNAAEAVREMRSLLNRHMPHNAAMAA